VLALGAVLAVWVVCFFTFTLKGEGAHPADGQYHPLRARGDGHYYYVYTLTMALDLDVHFDDELVRFGDPFASLGQRLGPYLLAHMRPVGSAILQVPAFWLAHAMAWVANLFGAGIVMHGYEPFHQTIVYLGNLLAAWLALLFAFRLARRHTSEGAAAYAALFIGLGTGIVFYASYWSSYNHTWSILFAAWFLDYWDLTRGRWDLRRCLALGTLLGFLVLVRQQDALIALIPAVEGVLALGQRLRQRRFREAGWLLLGGLVAALVASIIVFPQLALYARHFGGFFTLAEGEQRLRFESPFWSESLFSSRAGLFVWAPLAWIGAVGLCFPPRRSRVVAVASLALIALLAYANGATWGWDGGFSYGNRRMLAVTGAVVLGLALVIERLRALDARFPRLAPLAGFGLVMLPLVVMNLELSQQVSSGTKPQVTLGTSQSVAALYTGSLRRSLQQVMWRVGNPFAWPANLIWAWRHGVPPGQYDYVAGSERLYVHAADYRKPGANREETIRVGTGLGMLDAGGWSAPSTYLGRKVLWAGPRSRLLLPLFIQGDLKVAFTLAARQPVRIEILLNGHPYSFDLEAGFSVQRIDVPDGVLGTGTNDIDVRCAVRECVAVEKLVIRVEPRQASP
jgi:hypothetical protein